jgi:hypothetical protein
MTLLTGEVTGEIDAPLHRCWEVVEAIERSAEWQRGIEAVTVIERDTSGRAQLCEVVLDARIRQVRCQIAVSYDPPYRQSFTRVESADIDELSGGWDLSEAGPDRTRATYRLAVDPGPVGLLARPLERALRPIILGGRPDELARAVGARR